VQKRIMAYLEALHKETIEQELVVSRLSLQSQAKIEKMILGTLPVEAHWHV